MTAATSASCCVAGLVALLRVETTEADALLAAQTESALSKTALKVAEVNYMSAIWFRTA